MSTVSSDASPSLDPLFPRQRLNATPTAWRSTWLPGTQCRSSTSRGYRGMWVVMEECWAECERCRGVDEKVLAMKEDWRLARVCGFESGHETLPSDVRQALSRYCGLGLETEIHSQGWLRRILYDISCTTLRCWVKTPRDACHKCKPLCSFNNAATCDDTARSW